MEPLKKKKSKEVNILVSTDTVYVYIDTPHLKVLLPVNENTLKPTNFLKDGFMYIKSTNAMGFFLKQTLKTRIDYALKKIKTKKSKGE